MDLQTEVYVVVKVDTQEELDRVESAQYSGVLSELIRMWAKGGLGFVSAMSVSQPDTDGVDHSIKKQAVATKPADITPLTMVETIQPERKLVIDDSDTNGEVVEVQKPKRKRGLNGRTRRERV